MFSVSEAQCHGDVVFWAWFAATGPVKLAAIKTTMTSTLYENVLKTKTRNHARGQ